MRAIVFAAIVGALASPATAQSDRPYYEVVRDHKKAYFIQGTIRRAPGTAKAWVLLNFGDKEEDGVLYYFAYRQFDCVNDGYQDLSVTTYSARDVIKSSVDIPTLFRRPPPQTMEYELLNFVCSGKPLIARKKYDTLADALDSPDLLTILEGTTVDNKPTPKK